MRFLALIFVAVLASAGSSAMAAVTIQFSGPDYQKNEPVSDNSTVSITVTRVGSVDGVVEVDFKTEDDTAIAGEDYTALETVVRFEDREGFKIVKVEVLVDGVDEFNERFKVSLSNPRGDGDPELGDPSEAHVQINDSSGPPKISVSSLTIDEPISGEATATFTMTLSIRSEKSIYLKYSTHNGTAVGGQDFVALNSETTFAIGETEKTVEVKVNADNQTEAQEQFDLVIDSYEVGRLDPTSDFSGTATIPENEAIALSASSFTVTEPASGEEIAEVSVALSKAADVAINVDFATADGSALESQDYVPASGTLIFNPGETLKVVTVSVLADDATESEEQFKLTLTDQSGLLSPATLESTGTIPENDAVDNSNANNNGSSNENSNTGGNSNSDGGNSNSNDGNTNSDGTSNNNQPSFNTNGIDGNVNSNGIVNINTNGSTNEVPANDAALDNPGQASDQLGCGAAPCGASLTMMMPLTLLGILAMRRRFR